MELWICIKTTRCPILSREKKKRSEKVRRKSRSRSASPVIFRGRNAAMDAQEALARRYIALFVSLKFKIN